MYYIRSYFMSEKMPDANMAQAPPLPASHYVEATTTRLEHGQEESTQAIASLGFKLESKNHSDAHNQVDNVDALIVEPEIVDRLAVPVWATHEAVRLTCQGVKLEVLVDRRDQKRRVVSLARAGEPYHRLRLDARRGCLRFDGGGTKDATWTVVPAPLAAGSSDKSEHLEPGRFVYLRNNAGGSQGSLSSATGARSSSESPSSEASNHGAAEIAWWLSAVPKEGSLGVLCSPSSSSRNDKSNSDMGSCSSGVGSSNSSSSSKVGVSVGGPSDARVADVCRWRCEAIPFPRMSMQTSALGPHSSQKMPLESLSLCEPDNNGSGDGRGDGMPINDSSPGGGVFGTQALSEDGRLTALTPAEIEYFVKHGYVVCRGAAARAPCEEALAYVNSRLGRTGSTADSGEATATRGKRELESEPVTKVGGPASNATETCGVARSPAVNRLVARILGGEEKVMPMLGCQIALRFPRCVDALVAGGAACLETVDGKSWHTDGLRQGKQHSFSLLVGVALSDQGGHTNKDSSSDIAGATEGQLCVWPGSHLVTPGLMRWPDGKVKRDVGAASSVNGGVFGPVEGATRATGGGRGGGSGDGSGGCVDPGYEDTDGPLPDLGRPVALTLNTGDVLLAHHCLAHCGGPHLGYGIRYMLYFRVKHVNHAALVASQALNRGLFWEDLEGVQATARSILGDPQPSE